MPGGHGIKSRLGRVIIFWVGYFLILLVASIPKGMSPARWGSLVWGLTSSVAIIGLTLLLVKREGRVPRDVGLSVGAAAVGRFVAGIALGLCVYSLVLLLTSLLVTPIRFTRLAPLDASDICLMIGSYLALAVMEELGFRGYPLRTLVLALGRWQAQAVVAAAFCLSHVAFGWPWAVVAFGVLPGAILFGVAALAGGDLGMPIGVHAAMNVARWMVGQTANPGIWTIAVEESAHGRLAVFAPLVGFAVTVVCAGALWFWHSGKIRSPDQTPATR